MSLVLLAREEGAGLIQLYLNGQREGVIYHTHYGHWSEAGARRRIIHSADDCDRETLAKLSGLIQRHIRANRDQPQPLSKRLQT